MCSIAGWITPSPLSPESARRLAQGLLYFGMDRGQQSAGVLWGGTLLRRAMRPDDFIFTKEFIDLFATSSGSPICLLHTRQPTSGGTGDEQAQPFVRGKAATVHNGWFWNCSEVKAEFSLRKKSGVDSELVTAWVNAYGPESLPEFIESTEGSSAIACKHEENLFLIRDGNPIVTAQLKLGTGQPILLFASTAKQLISALRYTYLFTDVRVQEMKEGVLFHATPAGLEQLTSKKVSHSWTSYGVGWVDGPHYRGNYHRPYQKGAFSKSLEDPDLLATCFLDTEKRTRYFTSHDTKECEALLNEAREACRACSADPDDPSTYNWLDDASQTRYSG